MRVCIIGPGVVGQATGKVLAKQGISVAFLGGSSEKREKLVKEGYECYAKDETLKQFDFDVSMFTVPTPTVNGKINLDPIKKAAIDLGKRLKNTTSYHVAVVKSTVPPGTTEEIVTKQIEKYSGKKVGRDFGVCMNPEYLREVSAYEDTLKSWLIVIGQYDKRSGDVLAAVYSHFTCPIHRTTIKEAEMQKYVHNLYNAAKITFFNEMREIGKGIDVDVQKIFKLTALSAEGLWNPNYGIADLGPFDGSCLPKDTQAFLNWTRKKKLSANLLKTIINVNHALEKKEGIKVKKTIGMSL